MSDELDRLGKALLDAAYAYWRQAGKELGAAAIYWLDDDDGKTVIFTRGEYRGHLMSAVDGRLAPKRFHHLRTEEERDKGEGGWDEPLK